MKMTTLCYIEKEEQYLMLHRISKENDPNKDKWIGVGGKIKDKESPEDCLLREVKEETGLDLLEYQFRGLITFVSDEWETEYMYLYTAAKFKGELSECSEGKLEWVPKTQIYQLNLWEGDRKFLNLLMEEQEIFSMKLIYEGEKLVESIIQIWKK